MRKCLTVYLLLTMITVAATAAGKLSNRRAPGFSLPDLSMRQHDLADYRGKYVIVNVMKTDCPHCGAFSKNLAKAEKQYTGRLQVIDIVNPPDNKGSVERYLIQNGVSQLVLFDCGQVSASYLQVGPQNPTFDVPHFFLIDPKGWILDDYGYNALNRAIFEGEGLSRILEQHLGQPSASNPNPSSKANPSL